MQSFIKLRLVPKACKEKIMEIMDWHVYIACAQSGRYYTGASTNPQRRVHEHNKGLGAKFSRDHGKLTLLYVSPAYDKSTAWKREIQIKGWSRLKKEKLISGEWN